MNGAADAADAADTNRNGETGRASDIFHKVIRQTDTVTYSNYLII
jgi:hypothetical protein